MVNFVISTWRGGTPEARWYVMDIRRAPDVKFVAETPTEGLAKLLVALLNRNEDER